MRKSYENREITTFLSHVSPNVFHFQRETDFHGKRERHSTVLPSTELLPNKLHICVVSTKTVSLEYDFTTFPKPKLA